MKLINISNHPSSGWSEKQKEGWDCIIDMQFPMINPRASEEEISLLARDFFKNIVHNLYVDYRKGKSGKPDSFPEKNKIILEKLFSSVTFHVAGEWSFFYALISMVNKYHGKCVVACTERVVEEKVVNGQTQKSVIFEFVQWRKLS